MYYLIYSSTATRLLSDIDLSKILKESRANNFSLNITGLLLYKNGNFLQVLEGKKDIVNQLYHKITKDPRHHNLLVLLSGEIKERQFPEWQMGYKNLSKEPVEDLPGFIDFFDPKQRDLFSDNPTLVQKMMLKFKTVI